MKLKLFFASILLSSLFCWGINALGGKVENLLFLREIAKNPQQFTAGLTRQPVLEVKEVEDPGIGASSALAMAVDKNNDSAIIYERNSDAKLPIASLTKLMTALVALDLKETYNLSDVLTITSKAANQEGTLKDGNLKAGERISIKDLLNIMLIDSSNDAAFALTEKIGQEGFTELMNLYAQDLGLRNSYFINATGLEPDDPHNPMNRSTVKDLAKLAKYIAEKYPQIFEITIKPSYEILNSDGSVYRSIPQNTNELLADTPGIIGGKTGLAPAAKGCLLLVFKNPTNPRSYLINVILGSEDRFGDMKKLIEWEKTNYNQ